LSTIDSIVIILIFKPKEIAKGNEVNFFNCSNIDLSNPNLNKVQLWNYSDKNNYSPIGSGLFNVQDPYTFIESKFKFLNGSVFVNSFLNSITQYNRFVLSVAWKYEDPTSGNVSWHIQPVYSALKVYFRVPNKTVILDQRLSNNTQVGKLRKWEGDAIGFTPPPFITPGTSFEFPILSKQVIQGDQEIYANEKYNNWNKDISNIINHGEFIITSSVSSILSQFLPTYSNVTIKNLLESSSIDGGNIQFKDPWLIDYPDPQYGNAKRNRGMDAPFKSRPSPFSPDYYTNYNGDIYKGVFLNQGL
jgi:hypothetical protein